MLAVVVKAGDRSVSSARRGTDPVEEITPGTIHGDFGLGTSYDLVHGSDSPESAAREIKLWVPQPLNCARKTLL